MSTIFTHRDGTMEDGDPLQVSALLSELDGPLDDENPDVAVSDDDSGWMLSFFQSGRIVWENSDDEDGGAPRHMDSISRVDAVRVVELITASDFAGVNSMDWVPGY